MIMIVKTPGSQMGSPASAEEGGEEVGCERVEREVKSSAIDVDVDRTKSQIKVGRSCDPG